MLKRRASADSHNATQTTPKPPTKKHKKQSVNADKPNIEDKHANQDYQTMFKRELPELERRRDARVAELRNSTKFVATARVYGVYVLKPENLTNPTIPYTAGYLDCPSTVVWWKRFYDKDTEVYQILNGLREESQKQEKPYGMTVKPKMQIEAFFKNLNQGKFSQRDVEGTDEPPTSRFPADSQERLHIYWLRAARKVIDAVPESFPGPSSPALSRKYVVGVDLEAEDLFRFIICFYSFKHAFKSKHTNTKQHAWPELPIFCVDGTAQPNSAAQSAKNERQLGKLYKEWSDDPESQFGFSTKQEQDAQPKALDSVGQSTIKLPKDLPNLTDADREALLAEFAGQVLYLYKDREHQNRFFMPTPRQHEQKIRGDLNKVKEDFKANQAYSSLSPEEKKTFTKEQFTALQQQLNACSTTPPTWEKIVGILDPDLRFEDLGERVDELTGLHFRVFFREQQVFPWQPEAAAFMLEMIRGPLKACLNSSDTGLCKTSSTMMVITRAASDKRQEIDEWQRNRERVLAECRSQAGAAMSDDELITAHGLREKIGEKPQHKPVLVVGPPSAIGSWTKDQADFFDSVEHRRNITIRTFIGKTGRKDAALANTRSAGATAKDLETYCRDKLDPDDEATSRTCILTTYRSFQQRCFPSNAAHAGGGRGKKDGEDAVDGDGESEIDGGGEGEIDVDGNEDAIDKDDPEAVAHARLLIPRDLFSMLVLDEAHRAKNPDSLQATALYELLVAAIILCTATPFINSVRDFPGLLKFLFKAVRGRFPADYERLPDPAAFAALEETFVSDYDGNLANVPEEKHDTYLSALEPEAFKAQLKGNSSAPVNAEVSRNIVRLPMMLTTLRRVMGSTLVVSGHTIELGKDLPPFNVTFPELRLGPVEAALYNAAHHSCLQDPRSMVEEGETGNEEEEPPPANVRRQRLQHAALSVSLDQMFKRNVGTKAKRIHKRLDEGIDSFTVFYDWTKGDPHHPLPESRAAMARYMARISSKLKALSAELLEVVVRKEQKMLVYAHWPLNLWVIELFLEILQIPFRSIRAGVKTSDRMEAQYEYNHNPSMKVLVCSTRSASESLNLQLGGWHILVTDLVAINMLIQIIGRAFRIGQKHEQFIKVLVADESYDQVLLHKYLANYRAQIAATAEVQFSSSDWTRYNRRLGEEYERDGHDGETYEQFVERRLRMPHIDGLIRSILGLRGEVTDSWAKLDDVYEKNLDPEQRLFRLAFGGTIADEVLERLHGHKAPPSAGAGAKGGIPHANPPEPSYASIFSPAMMPRPRAEHQFTRDDHVEELIKAAKEMSALPHFSACDITQEDCLRAAKGWVPRPSPNVDRALKRLARSAEPGETAEAQSEGGDDSDDSDNDSDGDDGDDDSKRDGVDGDQSSQSKQDNVMDLPSRIRETVAAGSADNLPSDKDLIAPIDPATSDRESDDMDATQEGKISAQPPSDTIASSPQDDDMPDAEEHKMPSQPLSQPMEISPKADDTPKAEEPKTPENPPSDPMDFSPIATDGPQAEDPKTSKQSPAGTMEVNLETKNTVESTTDLAIASAGLPSAASPSSVEQMDSDQKARFDRYLKILSNLKGRDGIQLFLYKEFGCVTDDAREQAHETRRVAALLWIQREVRDGEEYRPDWDKYRGVCARPWETVWK